MSETSVRTERGHSVASPAAGLSRAIARGRDALLEAQQPDGHWLYELEADCTIPAEYILMMHFMDEIDAPLQRKLAVYLRRRQMENGGWPLYPGGAMDVSCSVKAYYALKLAGDDPEASHMRAAREAILRRGGAARANVFTRIALWQFAQLPWRAVPMVPVEIMLLPRWFPFNIYKIAYWSRTVMIPLAVLMSHRARARNPRDIGVAELFTVPPERERNYFPLRSRLNRCYLYIERCFRPFEPLIPSRIRRRATRRAHDWVIARLNGEDGLGAIFPAMVNAYEMLALLGYEPEHPLRRQANAALEKLLVVGDEEAYCQPCVSPVWDTALAAHSLIEAGETEGATGETVRKAVYEALDWLSERQVCAAGDWSEQRPDLAGGGWAFQYRNDPYPDLDDTAAVAWAMLRHDGARYGEPIRRAAAWLAGMQSRNGGFAAFDVDNTHYHLNEIPFADHGALLDPPSEDVSARVATILALLEHDGRDYTVVLKGVERYLLQMQRPEGAWWGRWGTNYVYGSWSVLVALDAMGVPKDHPALRRAAAWLKSMQRPDGGWGEDNDSYEVADPDPRFCRDSNMGSTSFQTAWAVLGLIAAGEAESEAVRRGVEHLIESQLPDGSWREPAFSAPGFPRVFYLKYHGYSHYFPLWALARYRNAVAGAP